jgi:hypothetical protein
LREQALPTGERRQAEYHLAHLREKAAPRGLIRQPLAYPFDDFIHGFIPFPLLKNALRSKWGFRISA